MWACSLFLSLYVIHVVNFCNIYNYNFFCRSMQSITERIFISKRQATQRWKVVDRSLWCLWREIHTHWWWEKRWRPVKNKKDIGKTYQQRNWSLQEIFGQVESLLWFIWSILASFTPWTKHRYCRHLFSNEIIKGNSSTSICCCRTRALQS